MYSSKINSLEIFNYSWEVLGPSRQKRALDTRKIVPIKAIKPWMPYYLSKSILKLWSTIRSTTNTSFGTSQQAGEKIDAFRRELGSNLSRNLVKRKGEGADMNKYIIDYREGAYQFRQTKTLTSSV